MKKVIIIGAGASGMCCAINCKTLDNEVIILEKNDSCGKKILKTGNGRCNYYNEDQDIKHYHSTSNLDGYITSERINKVLPFFDGIGIIPEIKDGYYYPKSNQAVSIKNTLELECVSKGIKIVTDCEVLNVKKEDNEFVVITNKETYKGDYLVISTGSKASIKDSDNVGYNIAKSFGHNIEPVLPGLVQLVSNTKLKEANGVRVKASLSLVENDKNIKEEYGELQITDYGLSGIVAMQLSSDISIGLNEGKKENIIINFLPGIDNPSKFIEDLSSRLKNRSISQILDGMINYKLVNVLLRLSNIKDEMYEELSARKKEDLINNLTSYKVEIDSTKDFDNAQICVGGVCLSELKTNFESSLVDNLYFTGEVIDVNGDCGGYNLTFAWLSSIVVGEEIRKK